LRIFVQLCKEKESTPSLDEIVSKLKTPISGGISSFQGVTREYDSQGVNEPRVKCLVYEAHESMVLKEFKKIAMQAYTEFDLLGIAIYHRLGEVVSLK